MIVEDNAADVLLIRRAIANAGLNAEIQIVENGEAAIRAFDAYDADPALTCPGLVILDINLPRRPGAEVLEHLRMSRRCFGTPVIVISTSDATKDREAAERLGANAYFRKPSEVAGFMKLGELVKALLQGRA